MCPSRAVGLLVEKTKLSGALGPPLHSCLPARCSSEVPSFVPFPPCFHTLKCQFLSPFPNICLTFCQPAEEEKQTPVNIVWQNKEECGPKGAFVSGLEHTQQGAGASFPARSRFSSSLWLKVLFLHIPRAGPVLQPGKPRGVFLIWGFQSQILVT